MAVFHCAYFDATRALEIPDERLVPKIPPAAVPVLADVYAATRRACREPVGAPPLRQCLSTARDVLVVVPDRSRHTDVRAVIRAVLDEVKDAGVPLERTTVLIALGTHRAMTAPEIEAKLGPDIARAYRVVNHDWDDPAQLVDLGRTDDGLPVQFNRLLRAHDFVISIGNITAHPVGGYSGGAKGLLPGIAGKRSTDYFHWAATRYELFEIFGNAENPVRHEMERIVEAAGLDFIVNTTEDAAMRLTGVFAGHFVAAHRAGVAFLKQGAPIPLPMALPDILVIGMGPDRPDFWAGAAGIYTAAALLKDEGVLVLLAACPEGVAPEHPVVGDYGYPRWEDARRAVEDGAVTDLTGASHVVTVGKILAHKRITVHLVSQGIPRRVSERLGFTWFEDPRAALDAALTRKGPDARILIYERI